MIVNPIKMVCAYMKNDCHISKFQVLNVYHYGTEFEKNIFKKNYDHFKK